MAQILRGNFRPKKSPIVEQPAEDLTTRFEAEALKRLGGSIAFVSKKRFTLGLDATDPNTLPSAGTDGPARGPSRS